MENPIKIDDLGVPLFLETPKCVSKLWTSEYMTVIILINGPGR